MPIIADLKPTSLFRAFVLNGLATATIIVMAIYLQERYTRITHEGQEIKKKTSWKGMLITFIITFLAAVLSYTLMYYTLGFGRTMVIEQ